jgi:hypothetical protein
MPLYDVTATISMRAWIRVEADSPEEAIAEAEEHSPSDYDYDRGTAEIDFNITPAAELVTDG